MPNQYADLSTRRTPQSEPARADQVVNHAGGYVFALDPLATLQRFLILGTDGGTYYASEKDQTKEAFNGVKAAFDAKPDEALDLIIDVSITGRAHRQGPTLLAYAYACAHPTVKARALTQLNRICRTGTMLFEWWTYVHQFRGSGPALHKAVARWYAQDPEKIEVQLEKYKQRGGVSHKLLLGLTHPKPVSDRHHELFAATVGKAEPTPTSLKGKLNALYALDESPESLEVIRYALNDRAISWEMLPSWALKDPAIWAALSLDMGMTALIRNLGRMTSIGLFDQPSRAGVIVNRLMDPEQIRRARIHPMSVLLAMTTYSAGRGVKGSLTWNPKPQITAALDKAFYLSFGNVEPTGKRRLMALDISGSMSSPIANTHLSCKQASAAMALVSIAAGDDVDVVGFSCDQGSRHSYTNEGTKLVDMSNVVTPTRRLDDVVNSYPAWHGGGTDCALPMVWAMAKNLRYDSFEIYTDNETWAGRVHPHQALTAYREKINPTARLVVVGMTSSGFTIADPTDPGSMDVVGYDAAAPQLISDFVAGKI